MRFVDFQVMTFFVGKRPLEERGRCILGCQKFSNGGAMLGANVMVKADFSCLSCGGFFGIAFIKNLALFFSKMSAFPSIFPQKKTTWLCFPIPVFHLRGFESTRRKPPRARCVQPSVTMERS